MIILMAKMIQDLIPPWALFLKTMIFKVTIYHPNNHKKFNVLKQDQL